MTGEIKSVALPTGVTLQYVEQGDSLGVAVLFVHGLSDSWYSFAQVLPHLPKSIRAFALSQRGHGDSARPMAGYATRDFASDLAAFMDIVQVKRAVIAGHSMGSFAARRLAIDSPERILGLVLIGSFLTGQNPAVTELQEAISTLTDPVDLDFVRDFQESTLARPVPHVFLETVVTESRKVPARVWKAAVAGVAEDDSTMELDRINAPTLIVSGERDELCPRSEQEVLAAKISDSRLMEYRGCGHGLHWEEPERFASDLVAFIQSATTSTALRPQRTKERF